MPAGPTISVVTISFNQANFLPDCLHSVTSQRDAGVEYVVVDPGSTDGSRDIVAAAHAAGAVDRVLFESDAGPADGLNKGFALTGGEVLCYLNSDDRFAEGAFDYVRAYFAAHPEVDVLCGAIRMIDEHGRRARRGRTADRFDVRRYVAGFCTVGQQATFFRRAAFERAGGFNAVNRVAWDGELLVDMALSGARFATTSRTLGEFRLYGGTITCSESYMTKLYAYRDRLREKVEALGVASYPPALERLFHFGYRVNPLRHARYLMVR